MLRMMHHQPVGPVSTEIGLESGGATLKRICRASQQCACILTQMSGAVQAS